MSDVDGTVTKSDVRGVIDSVVTERYEYAHRGVCRFYSQLALQHPSEIAGGLGGGGGGGQGQGQGAGRASGISGGDDGGEENGGEGNGEDGSDDEAKGGGAERVNRGRGSGGGGRVRFLYLSSRPMSIVNSSRKYLRGLTQEGPSLESSGVCARCHADSHMGGCNGIDVLSDDVDGPSLSSLPSPLSSPSLWARSRKKILSSKGREQPLSSSSLASATDRHALPRGPFFCHTGTLATVLYLELVQKAAHTFKADVLMRQVVLPFEVAGRRCPRPGSGEAGTSTTTTTAGGGEGGAPETIAGDDGSGPLFLAGFGNKSTDAAAYKMVGMDPRDIFIVNDRSRLVRMDGEAGGGSGRKGKMPKRLSLPSSASTQSSSSLAEGPSLAGSSSEHGSTSGTNAAAARRLLYSSTRDRNGVMPQMTSKRVEEATPFSLRLKEPPMRRRLSLPSSAIMQSYPSLAEVPSLAGLSSKHGLTGGTIAAAARRLLDSSTRDQDGVIGDDNRGGGLQAPTTDIGRGSGGSDLLDSDGENVSDLSSRNLRSSPLSLAGSGLVGLPKGYIDAGDGYKSDYDVTVLTDAVGGCCGCLAQTAGAGESRKTDAYEVVRPFPRDGALEITKGLLSNSKGAKSRLRKTISISSYFSYSKKSFMPTEAVRKENLHPGSAFRGYDDPRLIAVVRFRMMGSLAKAPAKRSGERRAGDGDGPRLTAGDREQPDKS